MTFKTGGFILGAIAAAITCASCTGEKGSRDAFSTLNHNPIEFYGRAVDQFGEPVATAEVRGAILYNTGTSSGERRVKTTTDAEGYFQFTGLEGQDIGIEIKKEGYEYHPRTTSFSYSYFEADHKRYIPNPKNPVFFPLWKKQGADTLVHYHKSWLVPVNAKPVRINLETGKIGDPQADLVVMITRTPLRMKFGARGFAWKVTVEVVGGGLVLAGDRDYYNAAPESGYEPRFERVQEAQSLHEAHGGEIKWTWRESASGDFFVSSRNGKNFARVILSFTPNYDQNEGDNVASIGAGVWLNPNGSHNLEFDPAKVITPPR